MAVSRQRAVAKNGQLTLEDVQQMLVKRGLTESQVAAVKDHELALAWMEEADRRAGSLTSPAAWLAKVLLSGNRPRERPKELPGLRKDDWQEEPENVLPPEENARRMAILNRAIVAGGFTDQMLEELYRDDLQGLIEHKRLTAEAETEKQLGRARTAHHRNGGVDVPF